MLKEYYPADPAASSVKERLDASPDGVVHLNATFDLLRDMSPGQSDDTAKDGRDDVDDHSEPPRDENIRSSPEKPCLDVVQDIAPMSSRVWLVPEEVDKDRARYEKAGNEH